MNYNNADNIFPFANIAKMYEYLKNIIHQRGVLFYRMTPIDKILLVEFLKENKSNIIGMCGDGSNDTGAIVAADFGVLLRNDHGFNQTGSHFYTKDNSISSIEFIIKNGRASLENLFITVKFLLIYGIIQLSSVVFIILKKTDFSEKQIFFLDVICVFIPVIFSSL